VTTTTPQFVSVPEAAALLGISPSHAYRLCAAGSLPGALRLGRRVIVFVPTLLAAAAASSPVPLSAHVPGAAPGPGQVAHDA